MSRAKQSLKSALAPLMRWLEAQLDQIRGSVDRVSDGQAELTRANRAVLDQRDAEQDVLTRSLTQQRVAIETLQADQRESREEIGALLEEVRALRAVVESRE